MWQTVTRPISMKLRHAGQILYTSIIPHFIKIRQTVYMLKLGQHQSQPDICGHFGQAKNLASPQYEILYNFFFGLGQD